MCANGGLHSPLTAGASLVRHRELSAVPRIVRMSGCLFVHDMQGMSRLIGPLRLRQLPRGHDLRPHPTIAAVT